VIWGRRRDEGDTEELERLGHHVWLHVDGSLDVRLLPPGPPPAGIVAVAGTPTPKETLP